MRFIYSVKFRTRRSFGDLRTLSESIQIILKAFKSIHRGFSLHISTPRAIT